MNPLSFAKKFIGSMGRERIKEKLQHDPTPNYHNKQTFYRSELIVNELPLFSILTGELMERTDPIVRFSHAVRNAVLNTAEVEITARNPRVKVWVQKQWDALWNKCRRELLSAKRFGYHALQIQYGGGNELSIEGVKEFHPRDVRALEYKGVRVGFKVRSCGDKNYGDYVKLFGPRGLWLTFNAEYGNPYGSGLLKRQYPPWYEKWMDRGARKLKQQRMIKDAYIGDRIWFPFNQVVEGPNGEVIPWKDIAREIGENRMSGSLLTLPMLLDSSTKQKLVEYEPPTDVGGTTQIFEWEKNLDEGILIGADVPVEVVKAAEGGTGFSGRSIPFMVLAGNCTSEITEIVQCIERDVLRPLAWLNWGGDPEFEIKPKSLIETLASDASGSAMGGGSLGGTPSQGMRPSMQPQPGQQPQQQAAVQFSDGGSAINFNDDKKPLHAPPGGVTIHGVFYKGGEFIPNEVIEELSDEDRQALRAGAIARHIKARPELAKSGSSEPQEKDMDKENELPKTFSAAGFEGWVKDGYVQTEDEDGMGKRFYPGDDTSKLPEEFRSWVDKSLESFESDEQGESEDESEDFQAEYENSRRMLARENERWAAKLKPAEVEAIDEYTNRSFDDLNAELRNKPISALNDERKTLYKNLVSAIKKFSLDEPVNTFRGMTLDSEQTKALFEKLKESQENGKPISFKGMVSTTINPDVAATEFSKSEDDVVLQMKAKSGAYLGALASGSENNEEEFLQSHGVKYRVVQISKKRISGQLRNVVEMEEV